MTEETAETSDRRNLARGGNGKFRRSLETVERDRRAAELAAQGWTYPAIAAELGYANRSVAYRAAQRCMYETAVEDGTTEELRRQQVEELRLVRQRMWKVLDNPPPAISRTGKIVVDEQGEPVEDAAAVLGAAAMIVKANERTSKLRGTEAPRRSVTMTGSASVAEIRAAMATWDPASIRAALEEAAAELAEKDAEAARRPILGTVEE